MASKLDAADRWLALCAAHGRIKRNWLYHFAECDMPRVLGGRLRALNRAYRVAVARGEVSPWSRTRYSQPSGDSGELAPGIQAKGGGLVTGGVR